MLCSRRFFILLSTKFFYIVMTHFDVEYHPVKEKWVIHQHSNAVRKQVAYRSTKKKAVKKAKGLATEFLHKVDGYNYSAEIHIYKMDGEMQRVEKVSIS